MKVPTVLLVRRRTAESLKLPRSALLVLENNPCFGLPGVYILSGLGGSHPTSTALPAFLPSALLHTQPWLPRLSFLAYQGNSPFPSLCSASKLEGTNNSPESDCFHKLFPQGKVRRWQSGPLRAATRHNFLKYVAQEQL